MVMNSVKSESVVPSANDHVLDGTLTPTCSWPPFHPFALKYICRSATQSKGVETFIEMSLGAGNPAFAQLAGVLPTSVTHSVLPPSTTYCASTAAASPKVK